MRRIVATITIALLLLLPRAANGALWTFDTLLSGSQENPANASSGSGSAQVLLDTVSRLVDVTGTYSGLSSNAVAARLHGFAGPSTNAPIIIPLMNSGGTSGTFSGSGTLVDDLSVQNMLSGLTYLNVTNGSFPGGEIRGQVINPLKIPEGDFNHNGVIDAADYVVWRKTNGSQTNYNLWRSNFGKPPGSGAGATGSAGAVPEPAMLVMLSTAMLGMYSRRRAKVS